MKHKDRYRNRAISAYQHGGAQALIKMILRERPSRNDVRGIVSTASKTLSDEQVDEICETLTALGLRATRKPRMERTATVQSDSDGCVWVRVGVRELGLSRGEQVNISLSDDGEITISR